MATKLWLQEAEADESTVDYLWIQMIAVQFYNLYPVSSIDIHRHS